MHAPTANVDPGILVAVKIAPMPPEAIATPPAMQPAHAKALQNPLPLKSSAAMSEGSCASCGELVRTPAKVISRHSASVQILDFVIFPCV